MGYPRHRQGNGLDESINNSCFWRMEIVFGKRRAISEIRQPTNGDGHIINKNEQEVIRERERERYELNASGNFNLTFQSIRFGFKMFRILC